MVFPGLHALPEQRSPCKAPQSPQGRGQTPGIAHVRTSYLWGSSCASLPRAGMCSICQCQTRLLMPSSQHTKLMWEEEHKAPLVVRASSVLLATLTTTATPLVISVAGLLFEIPVVFKPLQYLHHMVSWLKLAIPLWSVQSGETPAGVTCVLASDHSPDKQRPQTFPTFHSSDML